MSSFWRERQRRASIFNVASANSADLSLVLEDLEKAIWFSKICAYMQGFDMLIKANEVFGWSVSIRDVCSVWSEGCIIRGAILSTIFDALVGGEGVDVLDVAKIRQALIDNQQAMRATVRFAVEQAIPISALHGAISWFDAFASARMPQAITQAQRDAFGSHGIKLFESPHQKVHGAW
jgi:6-phosphogluconate dehydrogenase